MNEDEAEDASFASVDTRRSAGNNDALRGDHLAHHPAAGVG